MRYPANVQQWEQLKETDFEPEPFAFDKHAHLPADQTALSPRRTEMAMPVWEGQKVVDTVTRRALVPHDPQGEKSAKRWPVVFLTDDRDMDVRLAQRIRRPRIWLAKS